MSLYNALFGVNHLAEALLKILNVNQSPGGGYPSGRFRDIYLNKDGTQIVLCTRNGGGNREDYQWVFDSLQKHPNYLRDWDDDFDSTYAYIAFSVPKQFLDITKALATGEDPETIGERFSKVVENLKLGVNTAKTEKIVEVGREILDRIEKGTKVIEV